MPPFIGNVKNLVNLWYKLLKGVLWKEMTQFNIIFLCIPSAFTNKLCDYINQLIIVKHNWKVSNEWHTSMKGI